jgi:uncharacterized membrane protein (DUF106 family)
LIIDGKILSNNQNLKPISNGTTIDLDSEVNETKVTKQNQKVDQQKAKTKSHIKPIRNLRSNQKMAHGTKRAILKRLDKKEIVKNIILIILVFHIENINLSIIVFFQYCFQLFLQSKLTQYMN